jgi:hypothetical protein
VGGGGWHRPLVPRTIHPIFRVVANNHCAALCRHGRSWSPSCRGSMDGTQSSVLIFLLSTETYWADVDVVHPLMGNSSRGGLLVLSSFSCCSPHEAPPHEGLLCWASVVGLPLGRSWAVEGAQEQVDRDTPVSRTPTKVKKNLPCKHGLYVWHHHNTMSKGLYTHHLN